MSTESGWEMTKLQSALAGAGGILVALGGLSILAWVATSTASAPPADDSPSPRLQLFLPDWVVVFGLLSFAAGMLILIVTVGRALSAPRNVVGTEEDPPMTEHIVAEWTRRPNGHSSTPTENTRKRYRLEVYRPNTRDGSDRVMFFKTLAMARLNAWMGREIGAERIVIIDTESDRD